MDNEEIRALVFDHGSFSHKSGFAGDDFPRSVCPSVVGHPRLGKSSMRWRSTEYVGYDAQAQRSYLSLKYPIKNGIVEDWDGMEKLWHHIFYNKLRVSPEDYPVLLTEAPHNPKSNREKMLQVLFEKFNLPASYVAQPGVLCLLGTGMTWGIAVVCGEVISITPVDEYFLPFNATKRVNNMGGAALTDYLTDLLMERGYDLNSTSAEKEIVREIKEKLCYVALNPEKELATSMTSSSLHKSYELPDGQVITLNEERFKVAEALFDPSVLGRETPSLPQMIYDTIQKCSIDRRRDLYEHVIVAGGTTMFPGFTERLHEDMKALIPPTIRLRTNSPPDRKLSVWIGGSILASLSKFQRMWITREEYDETGPSIGYRKCFEIVKGV